MEIKVLEGIFYKCKKKKIEKGEIFDIFAFVLKKYNMVIVGSFVIFIVFRIKKKASFSQ